jgi:hypothetical protein
MPAKKEPFGGKQAAPFQKGKKEQENAKPKAGDKGRQRQTTGAAKKKASR